MFHLHLLMAAEQTAQTGGVMLSGWQAALAGVGLLIGGGGIASLFKLRGERTKIDADASEVITRAATSLISPLQAEISRLSGRVVNLEREQHNQRLVLADHSVWDHLALHKLLEAGISLPPCPPLFSPVTPTDGVDVTVAVTPHNPDTDPPPATQVA